MAEFVEVAKEEARMCKNRSCQRCPLSSENNGFKVTCTDLRFSRPLEYERIVMEWAEEHPMEYPYMIDVLHDVFNMPKSLNVSNTGIWEWLNTIRISEDVAEKLGVEPKEE